MKTDDELHQEYLDDVKKGEVFRGRALELAKQLQNLITEFEESGAERFEINTDDEYDLLTRTSFHDLYWLPSSMSC